MTREAITTDVAQLITIVSGLPRSGTSLMMQMLTRGGMEALVDEQRGADADNPRGYFEYEPVMRTRQDASWVELAIGKVVKVIHLLLTSLPEEHEYRIIFMRRALPELVRSQRVMLDRHGKRGASLNEEKLIDAFRGQVNSTLAWLDERNRFRVLEVDYKQLVTAPGPIVAEVNTFLGGCLDANRMLEAVDPSLYRQRG